MGHLDIDAAWFYVICCLLFVLFGLVIFLWILLYRLKSKLYTPLKEPSESIITTINSNRFNIQLQDRKESDQLRRIRADFEANQSEPQLTSYSYDNKEESSVSIDAPDKKQLHNEIENTKETKIKQTAIQQSLLLRQQMDRIVEELLATRNKKVTTDDVENIENFYELRENTKAKKKSIRASSRIRSKSTTDLDIYDVLPNRIQSTTVAAEDEEYSTPKGAHAVIVEDESGYLLPLSSKISYANASSN